MTAVSEMPRDSRAVAGIAETAAVAVDVAADPPVDMAVKAVAGATEDPRESPSWLILPRRQRLRLVPSVSALEEEEQEHARYARHARTHARTLEICDISRGPWYGKISPGNNESVTT